MPQALKPVAVAAVAVLMLYSRQPPSMLQPGEVVTVGSSGLASCAFLPAQLSNGCEPLRAAVTESGALVVFKGGKAVPTVPSGKGGRVEGEAEVVWSSPAAKNPKFAVRKWKLDFVCVAGAQRERCGTLGGGGGGGLTVQCLLVCWCLDISLTRWSVTRENNASSAALFCYRPLK